MLPAPSRKARKSSSNSTEAVICLDACKAARYSVDILRLTFAGLKSAAQGETMTGFADIPEVVVKFIRQEFAKANNSASNTSYLHPNMHEEQLDSDLVRSLSASPPTFFATEQAAVAIESHWLGGRWLWHRWEIADIAIFIILRRRGHLDSRKVALLQTKRLYSREIPVVGLTRADYVIGVGRIADRTDPARPLSVPRSFTFDVNCQYAALRLGPQIDPEDEAQPERIDHYMAE